MKPWKSLTRGERLELGLIQVDIAGHSKLSGSDQDLKRAKDTYAHIHCARVPVPDVGPIGAVVTKPDRS